MRAQLICVPRLTSDGAARIPTGPTRTAKRRIAIVKYHKVPMSIQETLPVLRLTSLYMCAVPPGLSPPPPSHSAMKRSLSMPHESAEYIDHRLHRSNGSALATMRCWSIVRTAK